MNRLLFGWPLIVLSVFSSASPASARADEPTMSDASPTFESLFFNRPGEDPPASTQRRGLFDRFGGMLSEADAPGGPLNTDRPSFTPATIVIPRGTVQVESGYTFNHDLTATERDDEHLFPELMVRYALNDWLEFRPFWSGQTYSTTRNRTDGTITRQDGPSDLLISFMGQLREKQEGWRPQSTLIVGLSVPTGGDSPNSSDGVEPVVFWTYAWDLTDRLNLAGSTGFSTLFDRGLPDLGTGDDNFEQYTQSLILSRALGDKSTLFYEWFMIAPVNSSNDRAQHFMNGGLLYLLTPSVQLDFRAGFGLGDHPTDFFSGAGVSFRF